MIGTLRYPPVLTAETATKILCGESVVSLNLGLSFSTIKRTMEGVVFPSGIFVKDEDLERIAKKKNSIFFPKGAEILQLAVSNHHYYKLVPTTEAPTLEIDGIRMHRTKDTTPNRDAFEKIGSLNLSAGKVLDTCTGLGYTTIEVLKKGVELVITVERQPEVFSLASINPWSELLFKDNRVHAMLGDIYNIIEFLPSSFFKYLIHDPPRMARAGRLYSSKFYLKLKRVMQPGGRMFHYTGETGSKYRRLDVRRGVMKRLKDSGFTNITYLKHLRGVVCEKLK